MTLIPMTDDWTETHVVLASDTGQPSGPGQTGPRRTVHFQEWWVRLHAAVPAADIIVEGAAQARPAPGVLEAIAAADVILLPPV